ncbi:unnamed protein product [Anisakis simplex]|uniref:Uncharacterized protein n=1 Tax=Anisakis simplex TaxID=6269 RepID=A0A0M3K7Z7_ANISI|nr:unnamed protein product [Anisakis simplex]
MLHFRGSVALVQIHESTLCSNSHYKFTLRKYRERRLYLSRRHCGPIATVHPVPFVTPGSAYPAYPPPPRNPSLYEASQSSSAVISSQPTINQPNANASICAEQFIANTDTSPPPPYCSAVNPPKSSS